MTSIKNSHQYLTFRLGKDAFAIEILQVREVLDYTEPTHVPRSPAFFVGIINLRGEMLPVLDLRILLGVQSEALGPEACVIVTEIGRRGERMIVGVVADAVQQVTDIDASAIRPPPRISDNTNVEFLHGIGKLNDRFIMIINMNRILSAEDLNVVETLSSLAAQTFLEEEAMLDDVASSADGQPS